MRKATTCCFICLMYAATAANAEAAETHRNKFYLKGELVLECKAEWKPVKPGKEISVCIDAEKERKFNEYHEELRRRTRESETKN